MPRHNIEIRGAREGALDNVDLDLPMRMLICFAGPAGSGARTMAIDVLFAQSRRLYMMALSVFERERLGGLAEVAVEEVHHLPPSLLIPGPVRAGTSVSKYMQISQSLIELFAVAAHIRCSDCAGECRSFSPGEGAERLIDMVAGESCLIVAPLAFQVGVDLGATLAEVQRAGYSRLWVSGELVRLEGISEGSRQALEAASEIAVIVDRVKAQSNRLTRITEAIRNAHLMARGKATAVVADAGREIWLNRRLTCEACGLGHEEIRWDQLQDSSHALGLQEDAAVADMTLTDVDSMVISEALEFCSEVRAHVSELSAAAAEEVEGLLHGIEASLLQSASLDLGHLRLNQDVASLSSGEFLRLALASAASLGLLGLLYVVDTPISLLDAPAREKTIGLLRQLVAEGNTVLLLDSAPQVIHACDLVVSFDAGKVELCEGDTASAPGLAAGAAPPPYVPGSSPCVIRASNVGNVVDADLTFPVGSLALVVGKSGAGKTTLLRDVVQIALKAALGRTRTARSTGSGTSLCLEQGGLRRHTFIDRGTAEVADHVVLRALGLFPRFAALYANTAAAQERGYSAEFFELERAGGRCTACEGSGRLRYDLEFLEDLTLLCATCEGRRYREEVLEVNVRGHSITEVLELSIEAARRSFVRERAIEVRLLAAIECGLGALHLGDRIGDLEPVKVLQLKLAMALDGASEKDIILVDHPCAGLHPADLQAVVASLRQLVKRGATVMVADAQPEMLDAADWIIEMGPGRGPRGGRVCYSGVAADFERG